MRHPADRSEGSAHSARQDNICADMPPLTRNERMVYETLQQCVRPMKAYDLLETLSDKGLDAPMTIYRALNGLKEKRLVHKIVSLNAFVSLEPGSGDRVNTVVICRRCGRAHCLTVKEPSIQEILAPTSVAIDHIVIEATGECAGSEACLA